MDLFLGGFTNTREIARQVESAAEDSTVKAIVLLVDSPGGTVDGLSELGDAVRAAAQRKRVVGQVQGLAASAGYYAIAGATEIVAERMSLVGSIGTIITIYDVAAAFKTAGIRTVVIASGQLKGTATMGTPLTSDEQAYLQGIVDAYFTDFRHAVMSGRGTKLSLADWTQVSDGRVFVASDALKYGLVDRLGTFAGTMRRLTAPTLSPVQQTQARAQRQRVALMALGVS